MQKCRERNWDMNVIKRATTLKMDNFVAIKNIQQRSDFAPCFATDACQTTAGAVYEESEFWTDICDKVTDMQLLNFTEILFYICFNKLSG